MKSLPVMLGFAFFLLTGPTEAAALKPAKAQPAIVSQQAVLLFDPPLDKSIRFRSEKVVEQKGGSRMSWAVSDYSFKKKGEEYELTVQPVDNGMGAPGTLPDGAAQGLLEFSRKPFVLTLSSEGEILRMENADAYWNGMLDILGAAAGTAPSAGKPMDPATKSGIAGATKMMREMPADVRLALLTDSIQPVLEFGNTEWNTSEAVTAEVEGPSPFGGPIKRQVRINLQSVNEDTAALTVHSTIPASEMARIVGGMMNRMAELAPKGTVDRSQMEAELRNGLKIVHETRASYEVSLHDGLLTRFTSTETVAADAPGQSDRRITTRSVTRLN